MSFGTDPKAVTRDEFLGRALRLIRLIVRQADTKGSNGWGILTLWLANLPARLCVVGTKGFGHHKWENAVYLA